MDKDTDKRTNKRRREDGQTDRQTVAPGGHMIDLIVITGQAEVDDLQGGTVIRIHEKQIFWL